MGFFETLLGSAHLIEHIVGVGVVIVHTSFSLHLRASVIALGRRREDGSDERPLSVLRERYARGELSDDEFHRRRAQLERAG